MTPDHLMLPPGSSMMLAESLLFITIDWQGLRGRHIIQLQASLDESDGPERAEAIANAVELFRNMVGLEVIEDAVNAGEWPACDEENASTDQDLINAAERRRLN
jgi:hypothetical protein